MTTIMLMDAMYLHAAHRPRALIYHFVWAPMRAKPCLVHRAAERLEDLLQQKASELDVHIRDVRVLPDRVYLAIAAPPTLAPHRIVCQFKAHTSRALRQEFREMTRIPTLWTRAYLVLAGDHLTADDALAAFDSVAVRHSGRAAGRSDHSKGI